ncbi:MAG: TonB-dependent receptor [Flavobacteriaceae bacterium]
MKLNKFLILLFILVSGNIFSQKGIISGQALDAEMNNEPLPFANAFIKGTSIGATTDFDGNFRLNVTEGTYTLVCSFVGYQTVEIENIIVVVGETVRLTPIILKPDEGESLDEVLVTASTKKKSVQSLLTEQKKAVELKTSIGAEELSQKSVSDASCAVTKISGVSKEEGSNNVYVRGLGDRYLNTTLNGLTLPSNSIDKKNINLDLFTTDIIENVSISKSYSPHFFADFSAGNVNISSKEYTGNGFFDISVKSEINTNAIGSDFVKSEGTGSFGFYNRYDNNPFAVVLSHGVDPVSAGTPIAYSISASAGKSFNIGDESRLSLFISASFDTNYTLFEGSEIDYTNDYNKIFPNVDRYKYSTNTTLLGSAIYRFNSNHKISFNSLFINSSADEVGFYGIQGVGYYRDSRSAVDTDRGFYQMNVQFNQDLIFVNQLLGNHTLTEKIKLDWGIGYNNVYSHEPDRKRISIEDYFFALDNDPTTNPVLLTNNSFDNQRYFQKMIDEELNGQFKMSYQVTENTKINIGYNGRIKSRDFENIRYGYKNFDDSLIVDPRNLNTIFNGQNVLVDSLVQTDVFRPIPGMSPTNRPGLPENTYSGNMYANGGFISAEFNINDKWLIVPGFRAEYFSQEIKYNVINLVNNTSLLKVTEEFYLPSLNVRYALDDNQNLRVSASKTISTPEFKEMAPYVYEDVTERIGGNPDLLGRQEGLSYTNVKDVSYSDILNIDLKYEWFMGSGQVFSFAGFAKQINNPVNLVVANDATGTQRYFRTGDKASVYGIELEIRKHILFDADEQAKLTAGLNATYMYTEQDLYSTISGTYSTSFARSKDQLQGASPFLLNADLSYNTSFGESVKSTFNMVSNYYSDRIYALGSGQLGNKIEKGFTALDFIWRNKIGDNIELNFSAKNILNSKNKIIREIQNGDEIILSNYKRGINLGLQFNYKF